MICHSFENNRYTFRYHKLQFVLKRKSKLISRFWRLWHSMCWLKYATSTNHNKMHIKLKTSSSFFQICLTLFVWIFLFCLCGGNCWAHTKFSADVGRQFCYLRIWDILSFLHFLALYLETLGELHQIKGQISIW